MRSAAILAGGRSVRFGGADKSALLVDGRPILDRQLRELQQITDDILLVGRSSGPPGDPRVRQVPDRRADCGPLGGLDTALAEARSDVVVALACDMPFVTAAFLAFLADLVDGAQAVVPRTEHGYHPLCAAYSRTCRRAVAAHLAARRLSMLGLLDDVTVRIVERNEIERFGAADRLLTNVNTPAEFRAIETHTSQKP